MPIIPPEGHTLTYSLALSFPATNNEAEYEALITRLLIAHGTGARKVHVKCNLQLVVNQLNGDYEAKEENMIRYLQRAKDSAGKFDSIEFMRIPRKDNNVADLLSRLATG